MSETPIKDKSILGAHGQKLCDNINVHWLTPVTGDDDDDDDDDDAGKTQCAEDYVYTQRSIKNVPLAIRS